MTVSVWLPLRAATALSTRERASYVRVVVAAFASVVVRRFPATSYVYVLVPVTGLTCFVIRRKSSNVYVVTFPFGSVTEARFPCVS